MASLSIRDWVTACCGLEPAALGEPAIDTDPGLSLTYGEKPSGPYVVRVLAVPDAERRLGRIWRLAVEAPHGYYSLEVATDDLRVGPPMVAPPPEPPHRPRDAARSPASPGGRT